MTCQPNLPKKNLQRFNTQPFARETPSLINPNSRPYKAKPMVNKHGVRVGGPAIFFAINDGKSNLKLLGFLILFL